MKNLGENFKYQVHLFICTKCEVLDDSGKVIPNAALEFRSKLKELCSHRFPKSLVRINVAGCLNLCGEGINAVIYPQNIWLSKLKLGEENKIVEMIAELMSKN